jgi:hypothetical protein
MNDEIKDKIAVLVVSCDKYSDLWNPFFRLFRHFWPDCPFSVYLLSNNIGSGIPQVKDLLVGDDVSWSDNLRKALTRLKEDYIFLFIEDLFLTGVVDSERVLSVLEWMLEADANYVRMNPYPPPDRNINDIVGVVSKGAVYRTSTVVSVWKKEVLFDLLEPGESAWDFEVYGAVRSDGYDRFFSTKEVQFPVLNTIVKSKWHTGVVKKIHSLNLDVHIDLTRREMMTTKEVIGLYLRRRLNALLWRFPSAFRKRIKEFVFQKKYDYSYRGRR